MSEPGSDCLHRLNRRRVLTAGAMLAGACTVWSSGWAAVLSPTSGRLPIAIAEFGGIGLPDPQAARAFTEIVASNLQGSSHFAAFAAEAIANTDHLPRFEQWRAKGAQALVVGRLDLSGGKLNARFRLWDVIAGAHLASHQYVSVWEDRKRVAHAISEAIYERLTGKQGNFASPTPEPAKP